MEGEEEASEQTMVENNGKLKKGRQYNKRKIRNKKSSTNKTSDKLHLITLEQVEEVLAPKSYPIDLNHVADNTSLPPAKQVFELILDTFQRRDVYEIFAEPVDPNEVEDYYEIITNPMDFGTMRAKLHEDMYQSLHQFEHDLLLIFKNAMHFNSSTTIFYKQARALNEVAIKLFHALKIDQHKFELEIKTTKRTSTIKIHNGDTNSNLESLPKILSDKRTNGESKGLVTRDRSLCSSLLNVDIQEDSYFKTMYPRSASLVNISQQELSYTESLMEFVKDLGQTARRVAQRKLQDSMASKHNDFIINIGNKKKTQIASLGTRRRRRSQFNDKKIVLGVPASRTIRRRNSIGKPMEIVENPTKKMKIEVKSLGKEKCNHLDDHMKQNQEKGAMKVPSWQPNNFDLNKGLTTVGSCTATQPFKIPRYHSYDMATTNTINNEVGCGYQLGSSASSIGREIYFKTTYLRSKLNEIDPCKISK